MKICHCTLPSINPNACETCGNNQDFTFPKPIKVSYAPTRKIIRRYDKEGNLIEEIIEE